MVLFNILYTIIQNSYHLDQASMGYLSMSYYLGMVIMYPTVGWSVNKFPPAYVLSISLLGVILSTLGFAFSDSFELLFLTRFIQGVFASFTYISCLLVTTKRIQREYHPVITGVVFATGASGGVLAQVIGQADILLWLAPGAVFKRTCWFGTASTLSILLSGKYKSI